MAVMARVLPIDLLLKYEKIKETEMNAAFTNIIEDWCQGVKEPKTTNGNKLKSPCPPKFNNIACVCQPYRNNQYFELEGPVS